MFIEIGLPASRAHLPQQHGQRIDTAVTASRQGATPPREETSWAGQPLRAENLRPLSFSKRRDFRSPSPEGPALLGFLGPSGRQLPSRKPRESQIRSIHDEDTQNPSIARAGFVHQVLSGRNKVLPQGAVWLCVLSKLHTLILYTYCCPVLRGNKEAPAGRGSTRNKLLFS